MPPIKGMPSNMGGLFSLAFCDLTIKLASTARLRTPASSHVKGRLRARSATLLCTIVSEIDRRDLIRRLLTGMSFQDKPQQDTRILVPENEQAGRSGLAFPAANVVRFRPEDSWRAAGELSECELMQTLKAA